MSKLLWLIVLLLAVWGCWRLWESPHLYNGRTIQFWARELDLYLTGEKFE